MTVYALKLLAKEHNITCLIRSAENLKYYTGFSTSNGWLIVDKNTSVFLTDSRYIEAAKNEIKTVDEIVEFESVPESVLPLLDTMKTSTLAIEAGKVTIAELEDLKARFPHINFDTSSLLDDCINGMRKQKYQEEIDCIIHAQRIAEQAFDHILTFIKPGKTEKEVQLELDYFMLRNGADDLSFETIVAAGANGSKPHAVPSEYKIKEGDFVTMDFGALWHGYHSDMTRTIAVSSVSTKMQEVYDTVLAAQKAGIALIEPGRSCSEVDLCARKLIEEAGYGKYFRHSFGHGVGIEIHEYPFESPKSTEILQKGNVVTAEPGIYIPGKFGVRIEDMLLVTDEKSKNENLTLAEKNLIVL